jgi:hypothetical protein
LFRISLNLGFAPLNGFIESDVAWAFQHFSAPRVPTDLNNPKISGVGIKRQKINDGG